MCIFIYLPITNDLIKNIHNEYEMYFFYDRQSADGNHKTALKVLKKSKTRKCFVELLKLVMNGKD